MSTTEDLKDKIQRIRNGMRVTKVVCTRSVKGRNGDSYVGFSAVWNSTQDDGGRDLVSTGEGSDEAESIQSMDLTEAIIASHILAREADIVAHQHAAAGGNISASYCKDAVAAIKNNYANLVVELLRDDSEAGNQS